MCVLIFFKFVTTSHECVYVVYMFVCVSAQVSVCVWFSNEYVCMSMCVFVYVYV